MLLVSLWSNAAQLWKLSLRHQIQTRIPTRPLVILIRRPQAIHPDLDLVPEVGVVIDTDAGHQLLPDNDVIDPLLRKAGVNEAGGQVLAAADQEPETIIDRGVVLHHIHALVHHLGVLAGL
jgi:hypothetical protein